HQADFLNDLSGFELHFAQRRFALESGAFPEEPAAIFQALRECFAIVRIHVDHLVAVFGRGSAGGGKDRKGECKEPHAWGALLRISSATSMAAFMAFTSWTRTMWAPFNTAAVTAAAEANSVSMGDSFIRNCLRDGPTRIGNSSAARWPRPARISAFCSFR